MHRKGQTSTDNPRFHGNWLTWGRAVSARTQSWIPELHGLPLPGAGTLPEKGPVAGYSSARLSNIGPRLCVLNWHPDVLLQVKSLQSQHQIPSFQVTKHPICVNKLGAQCTHLCTGGVWLGEGPLGFYIYSLYILYRLIHLKAVFSISSSPLSTNLALSKEPTHLCISLWLLSSKNSWRGGVSCKCMKQGFIGAVI